MTEIVNLNKFRKRQKRASKTRQAEQNRVSHGRTKAQKARDEAAEKTQKSKLDGHKLGDDESDE